MNPAPIFRRPVPWLGGLVALLALSCATAQEPVVDPPERVARLSLIEGNVSLAPAESEEWADAVLNRPLTSGDKLWVDQDGRAELQVDSSTIHLDHGTGFGFIELDDGVMQMSLTDGAAALRVRRLADRESVQIETPNATVFLRRPGEYHFEVDVQNDRTVVKTRSGEAQVVGKSKSYLVRANETGVFTGMDDLTADMSPLASRTAFEAWANDRDRDREESRSSRYVAAEVIGYEDLDEHGEWVSEPEYGYVWRPSYVAYNWAPYRYGRWVWVRPWGWTWVDDARWGFAPFHYGRWAYLRHRWCWVPGPRHLRPVYAPALVGWIGRPSLTVSVAFGSGIGWVPLAPHEVYVPWYRHTPRYIRHVNVSNTIIINNSHITNIYGGRDRPRDYRNRRHADAITVVQRDHFVGGRPIGGHRVRVSDRDLHQWRDEARPPAIAPERQSILAGEPRRGHPARSASRGSNPKERGDFRTPRQQVTGGEIKHHESLARERRNQRSDHRNDSRDPRNSGLDHPNQSTRERIAVRERNNAVAPGTERLEVMRGETRREPRAEDSPRRRDHWQRPPVRSLQANPPTRAREERRESFEQPRPVREQQSRREQPRAREWAPEHQSRQVQPRQTAPVQQPRGHEDRRTESRSTRQSNQGAGEGPRTQRSRSHSNPRYQER